MKSYWQRKLDSITQSIAGKKESLRTRDFVLKRGGYSGSNARQESLAKNGVIYQTEAMVRRTAERLGWEITALEKERDTIVAAMRAQALADKLRLARRSEPVSR